MQPGQILVNANGQRRKVLGVCDEVIFVSKTDNFNYANSLYTRYELEKNGWSLLEEPWTPNLDESYYYLDSYGEIQTEERGNNAHFQHRTLVGNVHRTEVDVELYKQKLIERMGRKEN